MHPLVVWGALVLIGILLDEERAALRQQAEDEKRRLESIRRRRGRLTSDAARKAAATALRAVAETIRTLKGERRAAARARDSIPRGSHEREQAHALVVSLSSRIDELYVRKAALLNGHITPRRQTRKPKRAKRFDGKRMKPVPFLQPARSQTILPSTSTKSVGNSEAAQDKKVALGYCAWSCPIIN